jgi:hypothetical protein
LKDEVGIRINGYHNHLQIGHSFSQSRRAGNSGFVGQMNIYQRYMGLMPGYFNESVIGIETRTDATVSGRAVNQFHERFAHRLIVFNDSDVCHGLL